jgi:hypothetical protein
MDGEFDETPERLSAASNNEPPPGRLAATTVLTLIVFVEGNRNFCQVASARVALQHPT